MKDLERLTHKIKQSTKKIVTRDHMAGWLHLHFRLSLFEECGARLLVTLDYCNFQISGVVLGDRARHLLLLHRHLGSRGIGHDSEIDVWRRPPPENKTRMTG